MKNLFAFLIIVLGAYIGAMLYNTAYPKRAIVSSVMVYEYDVIHHRIPVLDANEEFIYTDTIPRDTILYPADHPRMLKYIQLQQCIGDLATDSHCEECWRKVYQSDNLFPY